MHIQHFNNQILWNKFYSAVPITFFHNKVKLFLFSYIIYTVLLMHSVQMLNWDPTELQSRFSAHCEQILGINPGCIATWSPRCCAWCSQPHAFRCCINTYEMMNCHCLPCGAWIFSNEEDRTMGEKTNIVSAFVTMFYFFCLVLKWEESHFRKQS